MSLVADLAGDHVAEQLPGLAVEPHQLHLLDREVVVGAGVDLDAGQHQVGVEVLQAGRLLHHVLTGEIVAALLQHLHHGLRQRHSHRRCWRWSCRRRDNTCP